MHRQFVDLDRFGIEAVEHRPQGPDPAPGVTTKSGSRGAGAGSSGGDWLELRIQDAGASGAQLTRELSDAGVDGEVRVIPVPAELVGTWAVIEEGAKPRVPAPSTAPAQETVRLNSIEYGREVLRLPIAQVRESSGHFILWAGREAQPGEDVAASPATFVQWFDDMLTRERHPTP
jgi:hypothetical protein